MPSFPTTWAALPLLLRRRLLVAAAIIAALASLSYTLYLQNAALKAAIAPLLEDLTADSADRLAALGALSDRLRRATPAALGGLAPTRRRPGVEARAAGWAPAHPVLLIPGFVTSALEMWAGPPCAQGKGFRARWWGGWA